MRQRLQSGTVILAVLMLTACTQQVGRQQVTPRASGTWISPTVVDAKSDLSVMVGGSSVDPLRVVVRPGDFTGSGTVGSSPTLVSPPSWPGFSSIGDVRDIDVRGTLGAPLNLSFSAGASRPEAVPVVWRQDPQVGWYPVAVGDAGGTAVAERTAFSPHLPGVADIIGWVDGAARAAARWASGRTTPPACGAAPTWADLTAPALDVLLTCVQTNTLNGVARAEIKIRNNRGSVQEMFVPSGVAFAAVQDQPENVRQLVRTLSAKGDVVLLPAGKELTIGFTQPVTDQTVMVTPNMTAVALLSELAVQLSGLAEELGSMAVLPALLNVSECVGLKSDITSGVVPDSLEATKGLVASLFKCLAAAVGKDPVRVGIAQQLVAAGNGTPLSIVKSDGAFNPQVEKLSGKLNLAGKLAKWVQVFKVAEIARLAGTIWEANGEALGRAFTDLDPAAVHMMLKAKPLPAVAATLQTLLAAPVPALRGNPSGHLVNGELPGVPGSVSLEMSSPTPAFGDVTGDGVNDAAAVLNATSGAGGNDQTVVLYSGVRILGSFDPAAASHSYHAYVHKLVIVAGSVAVQWTGETDGTKNFAHSEWVARLTWNGRTVGISGLSQTG